MKTKSEAGKVVEATYTPGPWKVQNQVRLGNALGVYNSDNMPRLIANVNDSNETNMNRAQAEANARLIAAAPDLLDALKDAREHLEQYRYYAEKLRNEIGRGFYPDHYHNPQAMQETIDAAIAKATGEGV